MNSYAVLVGVSEYYDQQIKNLKHTNYAIEKLLNTLIEKGNFDPSNIKTFVKTDNARNLLELPTKYSIISFLLEFYRHWKIQKEDFFLFYFIGHGYGSVNGDQILTMDTCFEFLEDTAISTSVLINLIRRIFAQRKLLVFDACRNEVEGKLGEQEGLGKNKIEDFITLYACKPRERAYIPHEGNLPILTDAFIQAVENKNCVSVRDMEDLVIEYVTKESYKIAARQTPEIIAVGHDLSEIGFLSRSPFKKAESASDNYIKTIQEVNQELKYLYEEKYPHHARSYQPFITAAKPLEVWERNIDHKSFRRIAFELLEKGENADIYTISYMLRWGPDSILFEPLIESLSTKKYRGTVVWQALSALEVILRDERMVNRLNTDTKLHKEMIQLLRRQAKEHPTPKDAPFPFSTAVVWGKILQICKRLDIPEEDIFPKEVLKRL